MEANIGYGQLWGSWAGCNLVLLVPDSLRVDAAESADLPTLRALTSFQVCEAPGNFTLPAHEAIFSGFLPLPELGGYEVNEQGFRRLLRNTGARPMTSPAGLLFSGRTIFSASVAAGRDVVGFGGVQFFDPKSGGASLARHFPRFWFEGVKAHEPLYTKGDSKLSAVPCLHGAESAADFIHDNGLPWVLFINSAATHYPYACLENPIYGGDKQNIEFVLQCAAEKWWPYYPSASFLEWLIARQVASVEALDRKLGVLLERLLPINGRETVLLVISDHGEAGGEGGYVGHGVNTGVVLRVPMWAGIVS